MKIMNWSEVMSLVQWCFHFFPSSIIFQTGFQCGTVSKWPFGLWISEELGWQQNCWTLGWWLAKPFERQLIPNKKDWIWLDDTLIAAMKNETRIFSLPLDTLLASLKCALNCLEHSPPPSSNRQLLSSRPVRVGPDTKVFGRNHRQTCQVVR